MEDLFISYAHADFEKYIEPLLRELRSQEVTFWIDLEQIGWGDNFPARINEGLRRSRFVLLCLSQNFLESRWLEAEMGAAFAAQHSTGRSRILPLILNSWMELYFEYPLLSALSWVQFTEPVSSTVSRIRDIVRGCIIDNPHCFDVPQLISNDDPDAIQVTVESVHTGRRFTISINPRATVKWLAEQTQMVMGLSSSASTGGAEPFHLRWVPVDVRVEQAWMNLPSGKKKAHFYCGVR